MTDVHPDSRTEARESGPLGMPEPPEEGVPCGRCGDPVKKGDHAQASFDPPGWAHFDCVPRSELEKRYLWGDK